MPEFIDFYDNSTPLRVKRRGIQAGSLVVAYSGTDNQSVKIFGIRSGRPVVDVKFPASEWAQVVKLAKWLNKRYADYWDIWWVDEYKDWNVIGVARWSVPDGTEIASIVTMVEEQDTISVNDWWRACQASRVSMA